MLMMMRACRSAGVQVVNDVLSGCDTLDNKQQCMAAILRATPQVWRHSPAAAVSAVALEHRFRMVCLLP
jgi:hypothetical protein